MLAQDSALRESVLRWRVPPGVLFMHLPLWLILLLVGLSQISESIYTPSLPDIGKALAVSDSMVEYTLTIYLLGFAVGVLFWGQWSDKHGRKPGMLLGLLIFIVGSVGCYLSDSITMLMISRFVQAFGTSIGSVLSQAACRDVLTGADLGRAYAFITGSLGVFPAIGPVVGGYMAENLGWHNIFLVLSFWGVLLVGLVKKFMPETHARHSRQRVSMREILQQFLKDKHVIACGIVVGGANGLYFSYFAEGSFYMMELLGLSPSHYGQTFLLIAGSMWLSGWAGKRYQKNKSAYDLMLLGLRVVLAFGVLFMLSIGTSPWWAASKLQVAFATLGALVGMTFGVCMVTSGALAMALVKYRHCTAVASSLFGFGYYVLVSLITLGMGLCHNGTLYPMPLYFLTICLAMWFSRHGCDKSVVAK